MEGWPCKVCGALTLRQNLCEKHNHKCVAVGCKRTVYTAGRRCGFHRTAPRRETLVRRLARYIESHVASKTGWSDDLGYSCDERGCFICNGGGNAREDAELWLDGQEEHGFPPIPDEIYDPRERIEL